jgi:hypothetical protein
MSVKPSSGVRRTLKRARAVKAVSAESSCFITARRGEVEPAFLSKKSREKVKSQKGKRTLGVEGEGDDGDRDWGRKGHVSTDCCRKSTTPERTEFLLADQVELLKELTLPAATSETVSFCGDG